MASSRRALLMPGVGRRFESSEGFPHACDSESDGQVVAMIERFLSAVGE